MSKVSRRIKERARTIENHFYSEYILGQAISDYEMDYGKYVEAKVRKVLIISNGWYSKDKQPPNGHNAFVQKIIKETGQILSQEKSIEPLVDRIRNSEYKNWCWLAEKPEDITKICLESLLQQEYSDGDWDTLCGFNHIIGMCFEFSGG